MATKNKSLKNNDTACMQLGISDKRSGEITNTVSDIIDELERACFKITPAQLVKGIAKSITEPSEMLFAGIVAGQYMGVADIY